MGSSTKLYAFPKTVSPWNQLAFADSTTLENFKHSLLYSTVNPAEYQPEPEPEPEPEHHESVTLSLKLTLLIIKLKVRESN